MTATVDAQLAPDASANWVRRRFQDWPVRLAQFTQDSVSRPFVWGAWNCALAAAAEVRALTGVDFGDAYRGYSDRAGAYDALARVTGVRGAGALSAAATLALGAPLETPRLAQRGDIVLVALDNGPALGWSIGARVAVAGLRGVLFLSPSRASCAWRV